MGTKFRKRGSKIIHQKCRRCGRRAYNLGRGYCAACGYGKSKRLKRNQWKNKTIRKNRIR